MSIVHGDRSAGPIGRGLRKQLGAILVEGGFISEDELQRGLEEAQRTGGLLGDVLVSRGWLSTQALARALVAQCGLECIELAGVQVQQEVAAILPERYARTYAALPVSRLPDESLLVAVADPTNVVALDNLRLVLERNKPVFCVAPIDQLQQALVHAYARSATADFRRGEEVATGATDVGAAPAVAFVNALVRDACELGASDIHIAPHKHGSVVRLRVDGILRHRGTI